MSGEAMTRRTLVLAASLALTMGGAAIACRESSSASDAAAPATDASTDPVVVGDNDADVAFHSDAPHPCLPKEPPPQAALWGTSRARNKCDYADVEYVLKCYFGDPRIPSTTCEDAVKKPSWPGCERCIFGEEGRTPKPPEADGGFYLTPLTIHNGMVRINVAGCLSLATGEQSLNGCIGDWYGVEQCRASACDDCVGDPDRYESCRSLARDLPVCGAQRVSAECALIADDAGCGYANDFVEQAVVLARRFCADGDAGPLDIDAN